MEDVVNGKLEEVGSVFDDAGDGSVAVTEEVPSSPEVQGEQKAEPQPEAEVKPEGETKPQEVEAKPEEKKPEAKPEEETPLAQLLRDGKVVPLPEHIKLRQKKQAETNLRINAEARIAELEQQVEELQSSQQTTPTAEVNKEAGEKDSSPTDVVELTDSLKDLSDDDFLPDMTKKDLKGMLQKTAEAAAKVAVSRIEQKQKDVQLQQGVSRVLISEAEFKKSTPDYQVVTAAVQQLKLLNDDDRAAILRSDNPAKTYYEISKQKISTLRSIFGPSNNEKPNLQEEKKETETGPKEGSRSNSQQEDRIADELFENE